MFGDEIWSVYVQGQKYKSDLTRKEAEAIAERHQRGLCKHKDFGDHVEIRRDKEMIKEVDGWYKEAKAGNMQKYNLMGWRDD